MQNLIYRKRLYERWLIRYGKVFLHKKELQLIYNRLENTPLSWFGIDYPILTKRILNHN